MDARFDLELEADVDVLHRAAEQHRAVIAGLSRHLALATRGRVGGGGCRGGRRRCGRAAGAGAGRGQLRGHHRHLVADQQARLFLVAGAHARVGDDGGVDVLQLQVQAQRQRRGQPGVATQRPQGAQRGDAGGRREAQAGRPAQAQLGQALAVDLDQLDLDHDVAARPVVDGDQLLGELQHLGGVAHHQRVGARVGHDRLALDQRLEQRRHRCRLGVAQHEGAHLQFAVGALLGGGVGVDQHAVIVERAHRQLLRHQQQIERLAHACIGQEQRAARLGAHVAIADHAQPGAAGQGVERHADRHVTQLERDAAIEQGAVQACRRGARAGAGLGGLRRLCAGAAGQHQRGGERRQRRPGAVDAAGPGARWQAQCKGSGIDGATAGGWQRRIVGAARPSPGDGVFVEA